MGEPQRGGADPLDAVRTERTLRDVLREIPVDAVVPAGWRVGTEVVKFGDALPADGVTLRHPSYPHECLVTAAGTDGRTALAVYERDRRAGRRIAVAGVPPGRSERATLAEALDAAACAAGRIARDDPAGDAIDREPAVTLRGRIGGALRSLRLY